MELLEKVERINQRLIDQYGLFENGQANWRVIFSHDEFEYRHGCFATYDVHGNYIGEVEETRYVPKYRQWADNLYILERLLPVPDMQRRELVSKLSYEPVWTFRDIKGNPLPPKWEAIVLIIDSVLEASAHAVGVKYKDPESDPLEAIEIKKKRVDDLVVDLFGNETQTGDALAHKQAIIVPRNYEG